MQDINKNKSISHVLITLDILVCGKATREYMHAVITQ